jgi:hypothetical protein
MTATRVLLTESQADELQAIATREGVSPEDLMRQATGQPIAERRRSRQTAAAIAAVSRYRSGLSDVSTHRDASLHGTVSGDNPSSEEGIEPTPS